MRCCYCGKSKIMYFIYLTWNHTSPRLNDYWVYFKSNDIGRKVMQISAIFAKIIIMFVTEIEHFSSRKYWILLNFPIKVVFLIFNICSFLYVCSYVYHIWLNCTWVWNSWETTCQITFKGKCFNLNSYNSIKEWDIWKFVFYY